MKACIVTVYNSENCGSFWQAFALKSYIASIGYDVVFLRRNMKGSSHTLKAASSRFARALIKGQPRRAFDALKQYMLFDRAISVFNITDECGKEIDACILGSDTIWNLDSSYFAKELETYWGNKSRAKKTISYAASLANTDSKTISRYPKVVDYLNKLDAIGVRDQHTIDVLSQFTSKKIQTVCDPTLLYDKSFYDQFITRRRTDRYVFVYYFGKLPNDIEKQLRLFAGEKKLKIVVMGNSMEGDEQIYAFSPERFIECFQGAQFVITNTFHGSIFSIIYEKMTLFNSTGKNKVADLLDKCGMTDRDYPNFDDLSCAFTLDGYDYTSVRERLEKMRETSKDYLNDALERRD